LYVCYYFLNFLQDDDVGITHFLASLVVSMLIAKEGKILIKICSTLRNTMLRN